MRISDWSSDVCSSDLRVGCEVAGSCRVSCSCGPGRAGTLIGRRKAPKAEWHSDREDGTTRGMLQGWSSLEASDERKRTRRMSGLEAGYSGGHPGPKGGELFAVGQGLQYPRARKVTGVHAP